MASLAQAFAFSEEADGKPGLRSPQLGALHALLAQQSIESEDPITLVMPTGTGKTETMLAAFAHRPAPTLVIVPSDALRSQIVRKFATFGVLRDVGALSGEYLCPVVGLMRSTLKTAADAMELLDTCNVIVSSAAALSGSGAEAVAVLADRCERLFIDEAHHVAAPSWRAIAERFVGKQVVQFTATPFREDGQRLGGRIAYAFPLKLAQERGYFAKINYRSIRDLGNVDQSIAQAAVDQLKADLEAGRDHVLMARVQTIPRASEVLATYQRLAADLNPVRLDSKMTKANQTAALAALRDRTTRIVVCVDMLGEGFDLPALKIAAVHDPHRSLGITLQFIGRFARVAGDELGDASVFVPRDTADIDDRLRRLYSEDADWNALIRDLTHAEIEREQARSDFEASFGSLPSEVPLRNLQPKMSTVVYHSGALEWNPDAVHKIFHEENLLTQRIAVNDANRVLWFVSEEKSPVPWGQFSAFGEVVHHLYVVHAQPDKGLLYINSSDNSSLHAGLAEAVGGKGVSLIRGDVAYRVLHPIKRRVPTNVGLLDAVNRNRRFSMLVGANVLDGFGPAAAQKSRTNIFAYGYLDGSRVSVGASRKGRIWSYRVAHNLLDWVTWAESIGPILLDETISVESVMDGFIMPKPATERPPLVPLGVEWPYSLLASTSEARQVVWQEHSIPLLDIELGITSWESTGPIRFELRTDAWTLGYEMTFDADGPRVAATNGDAQIQLAKSTESLAKFMTDVGMTVFFEQEAVLGPDGYLIQPDRTRPKYAAESLEVADWTGVDITKESQGVNRHADSVQHRVIEVLSAESDWEVILDDDGKGEVADVVCLRRDEHILNVVLAHCKYSHGAQAGARLADLYEVCGQAVKSHKARSEMELVLRKLIRREKDRIAKGQSGLVKGNLDLLWAILREIHLLDPKVTIVLAQPGLSRAAITNPLAELLGCTQLYLSDTYNSGMRVLCNA